MNIIRLSIDDPDQEGGNFTVQLSDSAGTFGLSRRDENTFFITLSGTLDRETTPVYNISVTAWDNGTPPLSVSVLCPQGKKCQMLSSHQNEVKFYQLNHLYFSTFNWPLDILAGHGTMCVRNLHLLNSHSMLPQMLPNIL